MSVYIPKLAFRFLKFQLSLSLSLPLFHVTARLVWTATFLADSRQLRQLGAKCDKLSRIPREWRRRKIFTPRMPVGRSSFLSLYQLPWPSVSFAYPSFPHRPSFLLLPRPLSEPTPRQELVYPWAKSIYINQPCNLFLYFCESMPRIYAIGENIYADIRIAPLQLCIVILAFWVNTQVVLKSV